jgi:competence ComEA-like helix-hairpin-helix protein
VTTPPPGGFASERVTVIALVSICGAAPTAHAAQARPAASTRAAAKPAASGAIVNINTASAAELDALPGIGAKTAALIIEYRQKNGPFKKVEELMNVRGVEKNFRAETQISVALRRRSLVRRRAVTTASCECTMVINAHAKRFRIKVLHCASIWPGLPLELMFAAALCVTFEVAPPCLPR